MTGDLPTSVPPVNPETKPFWEATTDGRLLLCSCADCGRAYYYPRRQCPQCASTNTEWTEASGTGTVYSYTVTRRASGEYADAAPFVLAYVELEEGPRILTNIVDCDIECIDVGNPVDVVFDDVGDGRALPRFTFSGEGSASESENRDDEGRQ